MRATTLVKCRSARAMPRALKNQFLFIFLYLQHKTKNIKISLQSSAKTWGKVSLTSQSNNTFYINFFEIVLMSILDSASSTFPTISSIFQCFQTVLGCWTNLVSLNFCFLQKYLFYKRPSVIYAFYFSHQTEILL